MAPSFPTGEHDHPFVRYWRKPLSAVDVLAFRVARAFLFREPVPPPCPYQDLELLRKLLFSRAVHSLWVPDWQLNAVNLLPRYGAHDDTPLWPDVFDLLQRYYFEVNDPAIVTWADSMRPPILMTDIVYSPSTLR